MPLIYELPQNYLDKDTVSDEQEDDRGTGNLGSIANISDGDKLSYYGTKAPGTSRTNPTRNELDFDITFTTDQSVDSIIVIAENVVSATFTINSPASVGLGTRKAPSLTIGDRKIFIFDPVNRTSLRTATLKLIKTTGSADIKLYEIFLLKQLLDLTQSDTRAITRFETTREMRNTYIQEDLYGGRTLQIGHLTAPKRVINYQIWENANNLTTARTALEQLYDVQRKNPNFVIRDLDEDNATTIDSIFYAHWLPGSFSSTIEATQAISYNFTVEEQ